MIAPIPFGIGVDLGKSFATRWFVDYLAKFGFSVFSADVKLFKESAIASSTKENIDTNNHDSVLLRFYNRVLLKIEGEQVLQEMYFINNFIKWDGGVIER